MTQSRAWVRWLGLGLLGIVLAATGGWWVTGGRWDIMTTPSMSPGMPVGTLVLTRPLSGEPKVGDIYAFTPPGEKVVFIHQIVSGNPVTGYRTKGYLNSDDDPWTITRANVQAVAVAWFPGIGWVLRSLPIWVLVACAWWVLTTAVPEARTRWLAGFSMIVALVTPVLIWRFLISGQVIAATASSGLIHLYLVSTGVLPAGVSVGGRYLGVLGAGQAETFATATGRLHGPVLINLRAALPWWGPGVVALAVVSPLLIAGWLLWKDSRVPSSTAAEDAFPNGVLPQPARSRRPSGPRSHRVTSASRGVPPAARPRSPKGAATQETSNAPGRRRRVAPGSRVSASVEAGQR